MLIGFMVNRQRLCLPCLELPFHSSIFFFIITQACRVMSITRTFEKLLASERDINASLDELERDIDGKLIWFGRRMDDQFNCYNKQMENQFNCYNKQTGKNFPKALKEWRKSSTGIITNSRIFR